VLRFGPAIGRSFLPRSFHTGVHARRTDDTSVVFVDDRLTSSGRDSDASRSPKSSLGPCRSKKATLIGVVSAPIEGGLPPLSMDGVLAPEVIAVESQSGLRACALFVEVRPSRERRLAAARR
jgi:hypothetical protein